MKECTKTYFLLVFAAKHAAAIAIVAFSFFVASSQAQSRSDLEKKKAQLHKDIEYTNTLIEKTKSSKTTSLNHLLTLNKKISIREELIGTINKEIGMLGHQIDETSSIIRSLEEDLVKLKADYARSVYFAYKNRNAYTRLMFIFSSKDFNQAYKRLNYLKQYNESRREQAKIIEQTQDVLNERKIELENRKNDKVKLLDSEELEKQQLSDDKKEQLVVLTSLQEKEKQLRADLREKQQAENRLAKAIEDIIRHEMDLARERAKKEGRKYAGGMEMTPEALKLSADFASNKGKLPWPVEQGVITGTFGEHDHPVLKGIKTKNNGVDINSSEGAHARAVFDGEVTGVVLVPGAYKAVIIRHGEFFSVYSNLEEVSVKMGDKVTTKQNLGLIHTSDEEAKTEVHLEIWKGGTKMDPSGWLFMK